MKTIFYQLLLLLLGIASLLLGHEWEVWVAASLVCGAVGAAKEKDESWHS